MKIKLNNITKNELKSQNVIVNDLTVQNDHSYCVGKSKYIVHNCLTTKHLGIGYPKASLIKECDDIRKELVRENPNNNYPKIIADGGMKDYSDIIKALALGADYVMVGSIFNKALESSGENYLYNVKINPKLANKLYKKFPVKKKFYGMSTKIAQKKMGSKILKTSEGVVRYRNIEYTLKQWTENFDHYLRSAMSYTNSFDLQDFVGNVNFNLITDNAFKRYNK